MSYFESVPSAAGLNRLPSNPFKLLDFNYLILADGAEFKGSTGNREFCAVLLGGKSTFTVNGQTLGNVGSRPNVFSGKPHSVYIPCGSDYTVTAHGRVEVGLVSAPSDLRTAPYVIGPDKVTTGVWGAANFTRNFHQILTLAGQPELPAQRLIVGETYTPSGNWSTFPPHKHQVDELPREAYHEEMYYFKVSPSEGFGICHYYNEEGEEENFTVRDNSIHMMPRGFHTVVSAPGYTTYYLWFLAGNQRIQGAVEDPQLSWVGKTVAMLKELGH